MHLCEDGTHLVYSTADGHLLMLNIEWAFFCFLVTCRTHADDSFSQEQEFSFTESSLITSVSQPSSSQNCFFYASMNSISLVDSRVYKPVTRIPVNSSLGIITSLAYGFSVSTFLTARQRQRDFGGVDVARIDPSVQHALPAAGESLAAVGPRVHHAHAARPAVGAARGVECRLESIPTLWTASGNNRVYLWNLESGECCRALQVGEQEAVQLNHVPLKVGIAEASHAQSLAESAFGLVDSSMPVYQHSINAMVMPPYLTPRSPCGASGES